MSDHLFVYGTLLRETDHPRAGLLAYEDRLGHGRIAGELFDTGRFPAAVPSDDPGRTVRGAVHELRNPEVKLKRLDEEEGNAGEDADLFRRERVAVAMDDGRTVEAWVYFWNRPTTGLTPIPSGDYVAHLKERR